MWEKHREGTRIPITQSDESSTRVNSAISLTFRSCPGTPDLLSGHRLTLQPAGRTCCVTTGDFTCCAQPADRPGLGWTQCSGLTEMLSARSVAAVSPGTWKSKPRCSQALAPARSCTCCSEQGLDRLTCKYTATQQNPALHTALKSAPSCRELRTYSESAWTYWPTWKPRTEVWMYFEMPSSSFSPQMEGIHCTHWSGYRQAGFQSTQ